MSTEGKMTKMFVDDGNVKCVVRYKYKQNHEVIDLSDLDTSRCTDLSRLFYDMTELEKIKGFNTLDLANVTDMFMLCGNCCSLKELDLSGLDLHNVTDMSYMCEGCSSLKELDLSGLDLRNVTNMSYMCEGCSSLIEFKVDEQYHQDFKDVIQYDSRSIDFGMKHSPLEAQRQQLKAQSINNVSSEELKQLQQRIAKLQAIVDKITQILRNMHEILNDNAI